jgi:hypothetical protein
MIFNHEGSTHSHLFNIGKNDDSFYIRNDFEKFKERYAIRINNFKNYIQTHDHIVFVVSYTGNKDHAGNADIGVLNNLLKEIYPTKNIELRVI